MKKTILILVNHEIVIYNFRKELVERLLSDGHRVIISSPGGEKIDFLVGAGAEHDEVELNRHGFNPLEELKLLKYYKNIIKKYQPDIIFGYTIKPNIYGAIAAKSYKVPFVANITGLGTAVENPGILQKITIQMYRYAFSEIKTVYFQNTENLDFFVKHKLAIGKHKLLPGSGVNLEHFHLQTYPLNDGTIDFVFISRIMEEKGINQYLETAEYITRKYPFTTFHICGFCEEKYEEVLIDYQKRNIITYHGMINDVRDILKNTHCTIHPTYYPEGLSNVLLESSASGRPIISTDRSGCREVINEGENGFLVNEKDTWSLIDAVEKFITIPYKTKEQMGLNGRAKVANEFDRSIVIESYINELEF